ncbi:MAG: hypothetical protein AAGD06_08430 [Acidobacteriota bacterium]
MTAESLRRDGAPRRGGPKMEARRPSRRGTLWRILAAVPLNYVYTSVATAFAARHLPVDPAQASLTATLGSFLLFTAVVIVAFSVRSILRLWIFLVATGAAMGLMVWTSILLEGRG